ncbi:lipid-A-disaccharide synthase-related protein [Synechococcus sp. Cruz-9H2]|uniref:lipid-A-disaccharide synthase-related protein n=1 Tax=unclassified Synechococcus TaxID=2626047 RepID=UPI0020CF532E|nr:MULTISPECIES: lipid-A-disaccharide synthase-related protein [unclassified Synechococcus]MCP9820820.1 lipid-A-disaccharide synthase-related protein [Synechococcus sp. Cruz-9H2]MCP9845034.1 lipid-A-disaccharide synthase-related protein [Synechococcus sp. Edmonson 11F2]MCP9857176.1 lipid-A-disaccharide synthase-related protein [Synechococcus sp. Cruz-9C9]MCP9864440.1 lipid-A-disaccharide synthase-related protein [Synechococcus sp. Cruz-7E5]MCP9871730.1 lipid-A-disaccharide synthase-related pro
MGDPPRRLLLLSNGHGEDLSGSLIGQELQKLGLEVVALPLVGHGGAYRQAGLPVLGHTREFSTGGLGYTSLGGRLTELVQGQLTYLLSQLVLFFREARHCAAVVVVGDVIPVLAAWCSRRPVVTYLVAYSSHYEGRLRLPWPCGSCLRSRRFRRVFSRDAFTATDLSHQLGRPVDFLGNPFLDRVLESAPPLDGPGVGAPSPRLGLLPGSRLPEALRNFELMLQVLTRLPAALQASGGLQLNAALVGAIDKATVARLSRPLGWQLEPSGRLCRGELELRLHWGEFQAVVQQADLLLAMTGTATEQAVGLGKPVVQLAGGGPQFSPNFAEAQRRLLGPSLFSAEGEPGSERSLGGTAALVGEVLHQLQHTDLGERCRRNGLERIGGPGGAARMAGQILQVLNEPSAPLQ